MKGCASNVSSSSKKKQNQTASKRQASDQESLKKIENTPRSEAPKAQSLTRRESLKDQGKFIVNEKELKDAIDAVATCMEQKSEIGRVCKGVFLNGARLRIQARDKDYGELLNKAMTTLKGIIKAT